MRARRRRREATLQAFARCLTASSPKDAFVARLGGDEFVVVVPGGEACRALVPLLGQLLHDLRLPVAHDDGPIKVSATIGACLLTRVTLGRSEILHRADIALYEAKRAGRGCVKIDGEAGM